MNDPLKLVEKLALDARKEPDPVLNVADRVISAIRRSETPVSVWPQAAFVFGAAAAAGIALAACLPLFDLFSDPWSACLASTFGILL